MKMSRLVSCALVTAAFLSQPVECRVLRGTTPAVKVNPALSGLVGFDSTMFPFVNFMKEAGSQPSQTGTTFVYPNFLLQGSNLPNGTLPTARIDYSLQSPPNYFGEFVLNITGTVTGSGSNGFSFQRSGGGYSNFGQVYAKGAGTTLAGCSNGNVPPCFFQNGLFITGTNPNLTLDFSAPITGAINSPTTPGLVRLSIANAALFNGEAITVLGVVGSDGNGCGANGAFIISNRSSTTVDLVGSVFNSGASCTYTSGGQLFGFQATASTAPTGFGFTASSSYSGMTSMVFCKLADYNVDPTCNTDARHAWAGGFNDDFISKLAAEHPHHVRMLDVNTQINTPSTPTDWNGFPTTSAWSYNLQHDWWAISNWFGTDSGTNSYFISCANGQACTYALTAGAPVDGDFIQFYNVNANTSTAPTITITDAASVTSSAIPILELGGTQAHVFTTGSPTTGDTISLTFNTTPVGAGTCLAGGTHTTAAYTVLVSDTIGTVATGIFNIVAGDATLSAQSLVLTNRNPNGNTNFQLGWASNACILTISANITGAATEVVTIGQMSVGEIVANTLYTATYNAKLKGFLLSLTAGGAWGSWPYIVQMQLAQAVSTKSGYQTACWLQTPLLWSDASFTSLMNLAVANQCPGGMYHELSNEVWNNSAQAQEFPQAYYIAASLGLKGDDFVYYQLRSRQLWGIASSIFGGITGNLHTINAWQQGLSVSGGYTGNTLCGTSCGNQAYQNAIGIDYNSAPNRPIDYTRHLSEAPYYHGAMLNTSYQASASYGSWSATSSSVSANVLNVTGTVTGTIWWNQGVAGCDGTYIAPSTPTNPIGAQLTGTVTTTLNGAVSNFVHTWTMTSTAGIFPGMWIYNATTGTINATVATVVGNNITTAAGTFVFQSAGAHDTIVFGGGAGTYQLNNTSCSIASGTITGGDVLGLQYAADNYNQINGALGTVQDAYNWLYQDIWSAANHNQTTQGNSQSGLIYLYKLSGATATTYGVNIQDYEGGYDGTVPSTAQATSMGLSSTYGGTGGFIDLMLNTGFKNNVGFKNIVTAQYNLELSFKPAGSMTQWYVFDSNQRWALFPAGLYSTPWQSYNAICAFNGNPC